MFAKLHPGSRYYLTNIHARGVKPSAVLTWKDDLKESFWREFDEICDERQRRVARRYLVLANLFPLGEHPVEVRMEHDGKLYSVSQKITRSPARQDESNRASTHLDPHWKRFWPGEEDASAAVIEMAFGLVAAGERAGDEALTYEGERPVLTADFVETLNLDYETVGRVNSILQELRTEYLAEEKKQIAKVN